MAAVNNLSTQQIEAILLHELAHIRRYDYLVNLMLTAIHVTLYFNPFIKTFLKQIEADREACCDELVLQFEYDNIAYASALLKLETSHSQPQLAMAAANKNYLLHRIENIVGLSKKRKFQTAHFAGALAGLLMLLAINSLIISGKTKVSADVAMDTFAQPSSLFMYPTEDKEGVKNIRLQQHFITSKKTATKKPVAQTFSREFFAPAKLSFAEGFMQASYNENETVLALAEKKQVQNTISNTRKILESQWGEVEKAMADAMTETEKREAKIDYLQEVAGIDWQKLEKNLEATYNQRDWNQITNNVSEALVKVQLDSIETSCNMVLSELHKMESINSEGLLVLPDVSVKEITRAKAKLKIQLEAVRKAKAKKIIHL